MSRTHPTPEPAGDDQRGTVDPATGREPDDVRNSNDEPEAHHEEEDFHVGIVALRARIDQRITCQSHAPSACRYARRTTSPRASAHPHP